MLGQCAEVVAVPLDDIGEQFSHDHRGTSSKHGERLPQGVFHAQTADQDRRASMSCDMGASETG